MSGFVSDPETKKVFALCGNQCTFPGCPMTALLPATLHDESKVIGEMAHIKGEKSTAARYDPNQPSSERNKAVNLMLMCPNHHKTIDLQPNTYPVQTLLEWKQDHEANIHVRRYSEMLAVTFDDLKAVIDAVSIQPSSIIISFDLTPMMEKLRKNSLSDGVIDHFKMGAMKLQEVTFYVSQRAENDSDFPNRLVAGFQQRYYGLRADSLTGDDLFFGLFSMLQDNEVNLRRQATVMAVIVYLFEKCDLFER